MYPRIQDIQHIESTRRLSNDNLFSKSRHIIWRNYFWPVNNNSIYGINPNTIKKVFHSTVLHEPHPLPISWSLHSWGNIYFSNVTSSQTKAPVPAFRHKFSIQNQDPLPRALSYTESVCLWILNRTEDESRINVASQNQLWNFFRRQSFILKKMTYIKRSFPPKQQSGGSQKTKFWGTCLKYKLCASVRQIFKILSPEHLCKQLRWHWGGLTVLSSRWPWDPGHTTVYSFLLNWDPGHTTWRFSTVSFFTLLRL